MKIRKFKRSTRILCIVAVVLFVLFAAFTVLVKVIDVDTVGPEGSAIGCAALNTAVHKTLGTSELWYEISDLFGLVALAVIGIFGLVGLIQLIKRKSLLKVEPTILALGVFYVLVVICYVFFEVVVINHRPVLMDGVLEASYPSSHTMLVLTVMGSAIVVFRRSVASKTSKIIFECAADAIILITLVGRTLSGVHWITDIAGGVLLSAALITLYIAALRVMDELIAHRK